MVLAQWTRDEEFVVNRRFAGAQEDRAGFAFVGAPGGTWYSP